VANINVEQVMNRAISRRKVLQLAGLAALGVPLLSRAASAPQVQVYKNEGCGCCEGWITHLQKNGFVVSATNVPDTSVYRKKLGMPQELGSCHTAVVQGYAVEGHVPAAEIKRLLAEKPRAVGLAVPSMPPGSPGMEGPQPMPYDVILVGRDGKRSVYRHYDGKA
jgi:hypothetical protein